MRKLTMTGGAVLFTAAALLLAGCPSQNGSTTGGETSGSITGGTNASATVSVDADLPLTGPVAAWSGPYPAGFKMGVADESKATGISPGRVKLDFEDNAGKPATAVTVMQKEMIQKPDVFIAGTSEMAKAVGPTIDSANIPYLVAAFDAYLCKGHPNRVRILPNYKAEGPLYVRYAKQRKAERVFIIALNISSIQEEFQTLVEPGLRAAGITYHLEPFEFDNKDYHSIALKAKQFKPDLIFVSGFSFHIYPVLGALRSYGLIKDGSVMCTMDLVDLLHNGTPRSDLAGVAFSAPLVEIPGEVPSADQWRKRYRQQTGKDPSYVAAYAYDTARVLVAALKKFHKVDVQAIRGVMPFDGVTGKLKLDNDNDLVSTLDVGKVGQDGKVVKVAP